MAIDEQRIGDIVDRQLAARPGSRSDALAAAYYAVSREVFIDAAYVPGSELAYWKAVGHALQMKTELCRREMSPHPREADAHDRVDFFGYAAEVLLAVFEHYIECLVYLHDHLAFLPESPFKRFRDTASISRQLVELEEEREGHRGAWQAHRSSKVMLHRFGDLHEQADRMLEALAGQDNFRTYTADLAQALDLLREAQARYGRSSEMSN